MEVHCRIQAFLSTIPVLNSLKNCMTPVSPLQQNVQQETSVRKILKIWQLWDRSWLIICCIYLLRKPHSVKLNKNRTAKLIHHLSFLWQHSTVSQFQNNHLISVCYWHMLLTVNLFFTMSERNNSSTKTTWYLETLASYWPWNIYNVLVDTLLANLFVLLKVAATSSFPITRGGVFKSEHICQTKACFFGCCCCFCCSLLCNVC